MCALNRVLTRAEPCGKMSGDSGSASQELETGDLSTGPSSVGGDTGDSSCSSSEAQVTSILLELTNITWYLGSDGVKIGVPGLQMVNGQSNDVFDLRLCPIYQCWTYHFETSHKIMRNLKVRSYYVHTHI